MRLFVAKESACGGINCLAAVEEATKKVFECKNEFTT